MSAILHVNTLLAPFHCHMPPEGMGKVEEMGAALHTEARWRKAVQHLEETGDLANSKLDIPLLIKEISDDVDKEEEGRLRGKLGGLMCPLPATNADVREKIWDTADDIRDLLWSHFRQEFYRQATKGFGAWYIKHLNRNL